MDLDGRAESLVGFPARVTCGTDQNLTVLKHAAVLVEHMNITTSFMTAHVPSSCIISVKLTDLLSQCRNTINIIEKQSLVL